MIEFKRTTASEWQTWSPLANPPPPTAAEAPFKACYWQEDNPIGRPAHHGHCRVWRGVHFLAIRIDGREFRDGHPCTTVCTVSQETK